MRLPIENTMRAYHGKADTVNATSVNRRIFTVLVYFLYFTGMLILPFLKRNLFVIPGSKALAVVWIAVAIGAFFLHTRYFNEWSTSKDGITIGRWFFRLDFPWSWITAFDLGLPKEKRSSARRSTFMMHLSCIDRNLEISSSQFKTIFLLYKAIITFRPDLKIGE